MASIKQTESGTWRAQVARVGFPRVSQTFRTQKEAIKWARQVEAEIDAGKSPQSSPARAMTIAEGLDRYLATITPGKAPGSQRTDKSSAAHLKSALGGVRMPNLTPQALATYRDNRAKTGSSPSTVNHELALLSHLFNTAIQEWGVALVTNPVRLVRKMKLPRGRTRRLTVDETRRLLEQVDVAPNPMVGWFTRLALETAMRRTEILSLTIGQVDLSKRVVHLHHTKNGRERDVPLTVEAVAVLASAIEWAEGIAPGSGLVFPGSPGLDGQIRPYVLDKVFRDCVARAGITDFRIHDMRHDATSRLVESGLSDIMVRGITGHVSPSMLDRYTHLRGKDLVEKLPEKLRGD